MTSSDALFGMVADLGQDLANQLEDNPEQFADFRQGALQAVDIFDPVGWLGDAVSGADVDFKALKEDKASVYLVIPQDRIATHGTWLGLVTQQSNHGGSHVRAARAKCCSCWMSLRTWAGCPALRKA
jgi:type IV secretion system protein VirD4